jgi:hypothetical protein
MKTKLLIITIFLLCFINDNKAQQAELKAINSCLQNGDTKMLVFHFIDNIDLTLLTEDDIFSKSQAEAMIGDFFKKNKPNKLVVEHEGNSKSNDYYAIGTLSTSSGNYRVTFFLIKVNSSYKIKQLRIEKSNR